ncbi:MAG: sugar phosphate nucleotidyltransferase [Candidatus Woesearchaeota archaeon]
MQKKISISINEDLISKVDCLVDGIVIRNRSQAFEKVVREHFVKSPVRQALILMAKISRLNDSFLRRHLNNLSGLGIHEVFIAGGKNNKEVFGMLGSEFKEMKLNYFKEEKLLGTAGVMRALEKDIGSAFLVVSGDVRFEFDIKKMIDFHNEKKSIATMCLTSVELEKSTDNIAAEGDKVVFFEYKPKNRSNLINAAIYVFEPAIFGHLPRVGSLEADVFPVLAKKGLLYGYISNSSSWQQIA